ELFTQEASAGTAAADADTEPSATRTVLRLNRGELAVRLKPFHPSGRSSFNLSTEAGVLWTRTGNATFLVTIKDTEVVITVTEGEVSFTPPGKEPLAVQAGNALRAALLASETPLP